MKDSVSIIICCNLSIPTSGLSQGTYQTNKYIHFNKIRDCDTESAEIITEADDVFTKVRILP